MKTLRSYIEFFLKESLFSALFVPKYIIEDIDTSIKTKHFVGEKISKLQVMGLFDEIKTSAKNSYYVGITCNPERREKEHKTEFLAVVNCSSVKKANELEKEADKFGFDTGKLSGNANNEDSTKVYIYKKTNKTIE